MRILGIAGLVLALAIVGYLAVSYMQGVDTTPDALSSVPGARSGSSDLTRPGLEQRLAPVLDHERQRVEEFGKATTP